MLLLSTNKLSSLKRKKSLFICCKIDWYNIYWLSHTLITPYEIALGIIILNYNQLDNRIMSVSVNLLTFDNGYGVDKFTNYYLQS